MQSVVKVVKGKINSNKVIKFTGVCTDTRLEVNGRLFIALQGPNFDAHNFINQAEDLGASAIIAHKKICLIPCQSERFDNSFITFLSMEHLYH